MPSNKAKVKVDNLLTMKYAKHPHPRISSVEDRARLAIVEAGLKENKTKPTKPLDISLDLDSPEMKFGKVLAGSDVKARHKGVKKLKSYIENRCKVDENNKETGMSELDLMKLWKGLWYCLYLADKGRLLIEFHYGNHLTCFVSVSPCAR